MIEYGSLKWELMGELNPSETEPVIDKNRYSAFFKTDLDDRLLSLGIEDLIICGVMTNCCCETTARDAFVHDYRFSLWPMPQLLPTGNSTSPP